MTVIKGIAWAQARFGSSWREVCAGVPAVLRDRHRGMVEAQEAAPLRKKLVYGSIYQAVHEGLVEELRGLPNADVFRPKGASYELVAIEGHVLFPWRFTHDATTELDDTPLGRPASPTRRAIVNGIRRPEMLDLGLELPEPEDLAGPELQEVACLRQAFAEVADEQPVVLIPYASNASALLRAYWGDATLGADDRLVWGFRELIDLTGPTDPVGRRRPEAVPDERPSFDSAPLSAPVLKPRVRPAEASDA
ncbi:hypothetical protein [Modestobacter caceresii]|nr:hypothetical protein [Modestobacter caceresii]